MCTGAHSARIANFVQIILCIEFLIDTNSICTLDWHLLKPQRSFLHLRYVLIYISLLIPIIFYAQTFVRKRKKKIQNCCKNLSTYIWSLVHAILRQGKMCMILFSDVTSKVTGHVKISLLL